MPENNENIEKKEEEISENMSSRKVYDELLENLKHHEEIVDSLSTKLAENYYQMIKILSVLVTFKEDVYVGSHSQFVAQRSEAVAKLLGMSDEEAFNLRLAGLMHDIGKAGFRDILHQKAINQMTDAEYKIYTMHPALSVEILSNHSAFDSVHEIIMQHHERLDGSGFPYHLQGREINPYSAIIAVVDTFHNRYFRHNKDKISKVKNMFFTSTPQYMEHTQSRFAKAMNYLHNKKGQLFDSKVVDIFTEIIEQERKEVGKRTVRREFVQRIEPGSFFAEDYYSTAGLLIAARGDLVTKDKKEALVRFAASGEIPDKILVMK